MGSAIKTLRTILFHKAAHRRDVAGAPTTFDTELYKQLREEGVSKDVALKLATGTGPPAEARYVETGGQVPAKPEKKVEVAPPEKEPVPPKKTYWEREEERFEEIPEEGLSRLAKPYVRGAYGMAKTAVHYGKVGLGYMVARPGAPASAIQYEGVAPALAPELRYTKTGLSAKARAAAIAAPAAVSYIATERGALETLGAMSVLYGGMDVVRSHIARPLAKKYDIRSVQYRPEKVTHGKGYDIYKKVKLRGMDVKGEQFVDITADVKVPATQRLEAFKETTKVIGKGLRRYDIQFVSKKGTEIEILKAKGTLTTIKPGLGGKIKVIQQQLSFKERFIDISRYRGYRETGILKKGKLSAKATVFETKPGVKIIRTPSATGLYQRIKDLTVKTPSGEKIPMGQLVKIPRDYGISTIKSKEGVSTTLHVPFTAPDVGVPKIIVGKGKAKTIAALQKQYLPEYITRKKASVAAMTKAKPVAKAAPDVGAITQGLKVKPKTPISTIAAASAISTQRQRPKTIQTQVRKPKRKEAVTTAQVIGKKTRPVTRTVLPIQVPKKRLKAGVAQMGMPRQRERITQIPIQVPTPKQRQLLVPSQITPPTQRPKVTPIPGITPPPLKKRTTLPFDFDLPKYGRRRVRKRRLPSLRRRPSYAPSLGGVLSRRKIPKAPRGVLTGLEIRFPVKKKRRLRLAL